MASTRWLPPKPIGLGSLRLAEARALARPLAAVSLACLSLAPCHLPVLLGSIPVTELLRYYEDSDAFRARLFAPLSGMNSASPPGSRSPLHLTPPSNHPVSNHLRALMPLSGTLCGGLPESCPPLPVGIRFSGFALRSWARRALKPNRVQLGSAYGLVVRFQLLPTPPLSDALTFSYQGSASPPLGTFTQLLECARGRTSARVPTGACTIGGGRRCYGDASYGRRMLRWGTKELLIRS